MIWHISFPLEDSIVAITLENNFALITQHIAQDLNMFNCENKRCSQGASIFHDAES